jgi:23S rRNA (cytosine1962-C5)-methyltransferase
MAVFHNYENFLSMSQPILQLKSQADRRLRAGHQWIYSNEVDTAVSPLEGFSSGQQALVVSHQQKPMGTAFVNPKTLICGRLISRNAKLWMDKSLLVHRLNIALSLRQQFYDQPYYRLVYGDSDGLSGLVIDRFNDTIVVQISTAGMELLKAEIFEAIEQVIKPAAIVFKNDGKMRKSEGLESSVEVAKGEIGDAVIVVENGVEMLAPVLAGQKTGWFYDHRNSRAKLQQIAGGKRVLDMFSYVGGWGLQAAAAGAKEVVCVDSSDLALDCLYTAADANGTADRVQTLQGDAFQAMKSLAEEKEKFDIVVMDPPAFIARRKDQKSGEQAYIRANQLAMRLLSKEGMLISASCSMHLSRDRLTDIIRQSSRQLDRHSQIVESIHQGADHPVHPAIPETEYLKSLFVRVTPTQ